MSDQTLSNVKILTAVSFLLTQVVANNSLMLPMFIVLLLGVASVVSGSVTGFVISSLVLAACVYLLLSGLENKTKVSKRWSGVSIIILVALAGYAVLSSPVTLPLVSIISFVFFFCSVGVYFVGAARMAKNSTEVQSVAAENDNE